MTPIRGIQISYDEESVLVFNQNTIGCYPFESLSNQVKNSEKIIEETEGHIIHNENSNFAKCLWSIRNFIYLFDLKE